MKGETLMEQETVRQVEELEKALQVDEIEDLEADLDSETDWDPEQEDPAPLHLLRPGDGLIAAFFVPVVVMIIIFAQRGIFPFGEESFLRTDMYHQYAPFFSEFQYKLREGGSLLYSWNVGMGINFSALYAYYLASPFNWLLILCPKSYVIEFMTYGIVLKTGLAGLSFAWYLRRRSGVSAFGAGFFGIFYALSGYMAAYSWNIMWLDCIILLPLIMLGLERLVRWQKPCLYCLALGASILSNYYISIMVCIFMALYVIALVILYPPKRLSQAFQICGQFVFGSLAAGGLAAVVLLPAVYALKTTASGNIDFPSTFTSYFSIFDMIARHIANVQTEIGLDHWPNIYCGTAVLMFFVLYLISKQISLREKAVYCGLLLIFFASFSTNVLNFIWHGFHYPNSLPCRQSFIYIALILTICYQAYIHLDQTSWKEAAFSFMAAVAFVILAEKLVTNTEQFHFVVYYVAIIFLAAYGGLLALFLKKKASVDLVLLLALAVVAIESAANMAVTSVPTTSRTAYTRDNADVLALTRRINRDTFYRVEKVERKTKNDGAWMNFPSVSIFSSTANAHLSDFFEKLGCESSTNAYSITGSTPLVDCLFSVRYGVYDSQQSDDALLSYQDKQGDSWLYQNRYTLPVAFVMPDDLEPNWNLDYGNPAQVQNDISDILDLDPVLIQEETYSEGSGTGFVTQEPGQYYVCIGNQKVKDVRAIVGESTLNFDHVDRGYFLELGYCPAGVQITLESTGEDNYALQAQLYRFNPQGLEQVYQALNRNPMTVTRWTDRELDGSVTTEKSGVLYTSIPYDKGWRVTVDGTEITPRELFDTFLGIDLSSGNHVVRLSYEPQGLRTGAWITAGSAGAIGLTALAGWALKQSKKKKSAARLQSNEQQGE